MLYRYNLRAALDGKEIFNGNFTSINQLIKFASSFNDGVVLVAEDVIFDKLIPIYSLVIEFRREYKGI